MQSFLAFIIALTMAACPPDLGNARTKLDEAVTAIKAQLEVNRKAAMEELERQSKPYYFYEHKKLSAYEWTGSPCADGVYPQRGFTVASNDPNLWHKWINIDGYGRFYVHDRMAQRMGTGIIDIYLGDPAECISFGRQEADIYIYYEQ